MSHRNLLSLPALIIEHESQHPERHWTLAQRISPRAGTVYRAASSPIDYVAVAPDPNPDIVRAEAATPEAALMRVLIYLRNQKARKEDAATRLREAQPEGEAQPETQTSP